MHPDRCRICTGGKAHVKRSIRAAGPSNFGDDMCIVTHLLLDIFLKKRSLIWPPRQLSYLQHLNQRLGEVGKIITLSTARKVSSYGREQTLSETVKVEREYICRRVSLDKIICYHIIKIDRDEVLVDQQYACLKVQSILFLSVHCFNLCSF